MVNVHHAAEDACTSHVSFNFVPNGGKRRAKPQVVSSKLNLVDLAGSERLKKALDQVPT